MKIIYFSCATWLLPAIVGCSAAPREPVSRHEKVASAIVTDAATQITAIQFLEIRRDLPAVFKRTRQVLSAFTTNPVLSDPAVVESISMPDVTEDGTSIQSQVVRMNWSSIADLRIDYHSRSDTIDALNVTVPKMHFRGPSDVEELSARMRAREAFDSLVKAGLVSLDHVDFSEATLHTISEGQASSDGSASDQWVASYVFFAPMRVNGIPVLQDARDLGVLIEVHHSGEIRRVRVDAVGIISDEPASSIAGPTAQAILQSSDAETDAAKGPFSNNVVESIGVRYTLPPDGNTTPRFPHEVFRVHSELAVGGVGTVRSKSFIFSYDLGSRMPIREVFPRSLSPLLEPSTK